MAIKNIVNLTKMAAVLALAFGPCVCASAQSLTTGAISGTVSDASGAVVPNAAVDLKSSDSGATASTKTNQIGEYRFALLKPGNYVVTVTQSGFKRADAPVQVSVGQIVTTNIRIEVGQTAQSIEVAASVALLNPDPSMNTPFTPQELASLPSPGGDITNILSTVPGVVTNVTGGYGNFTANGMPGTSNLYTVNGENNMDPYFNINNSGASNLTLGQNELQEASVTTNPYAGQYGQLAGAQVSYVTKSGSNEFHGNAQYWWNGRAMNANNWFNNYYGDPRPFSNANQWAVGAGGHIIKNKTFFFVDNEGMRFVLPVWNSVTIPTKEFGQAVIANVQNKQPAEAGTYQKMMNLWWGAPGADGAQPIANSSYCKTLALPGFNPTTQSCAQRFTVAPTALGSEWILAWRVDHRFSDRDTAYFRHKIDRGIQPTHVDAINHAFDALSSQPSWDTQFHETHVFGSAITNDFAASLGHYVAQFQQNHDAAYSAMPYDIISSGAVPFNEINPMRSYPQGRNITQYQFIDDLAVIRGAHSLKFGANFRRYDVSDHGFYYNYPAVYFGYVNSGLQRFADGVAYQYRMRNNFSSNVPIAMWGLGVYAQDEWRVAPNLKLTLALRAEKNSNPVCQRNCFANFAGDWNSLASVTSSNPGSVPYASDINAGLHQAFPSVDALNLSPRIGFSWSPANNDKTVVSGGFGIFYDTAPAGLLSNLLANPPVVVDIRVRPSAGVLGFDPGPNGGGAIWKASASSFALNKTFSQISTAMSALGAAFSAPAVTSVVGKLSSPQWQEWNLQVQRQVSQSVVVVANYVGNHGIRLPYLSNWANAYDQYGLYPTVKGISSSVPNGNYGQVGQYRSGAISSYQGLTLSVRKQFSGWFSTHASYTWSHNIDEISNGGVFTYGDSTLTQINPLSLRANNYGNSDYDIRQQFSADFVVSPKVHFANKAAQAVLNNWSLSGKWWWRTGLPFSIFDGNSALGNGGGSILATPIGGHPMIAGGCTSAAVDTPCLNASAFLDGSTLDSYPGWSPQTRNQFHGPHMFDIDMNLFRNFRLGASETRKLSIGVQAFNVFNHPNFNNPDNDVSSSTFGTITSMVGLPTSPYGTFLGYDTSPRAIQLTGKFVF